MPARTRSSESSSKSSSTSTTGLFAVQSREHVADRSRAGTWRCSSSALAALAHARASRARPRPPARSAARSCPARRASARPWQTAPRHSRSTSSGASSCPCRAAPRRASAAGSRRPTRDSRRGAGARRYAAAPRVPARAWPRGSAASPAERAARDEFSPRSRLGPLVSWPQGRSQQREAQTMMLAPVFGCVQTALWGVVRTPCCKESGDPSPRVGDFPAGGVAAPARHTYGRAQSAARSRSKSKPEVDGAPSQHGSSR